MRIVKFSLALVAAALLAFFVSHVRRVHAQTANAKPNTIIYTITKTSPAGESQTHTRIEALRSDGDQAFSAEGLTRVVLLELGTSVLYNPTQDIKTSSGDGVPKPFIPETPGANCETYGSRLTGKEKLILGFRTIQVVIQDSSSAPQFGCKPLLSISTWTHGGVDGGSYTMTASSASLGEPNPNLFLIPESAAEMSPGDFYKASGDTLGKSMKDRMNKEYADAKAKRDSLQARARSLLLRLDMSI